MSFKALFISLIISTTGDDNVNGKRLDDPIKEQEIIKRWSLDNSFDVTYYQ
jgi:hypothetical protein